MLRCIVLWLFYKFEERAEKEKENEDDFMATYRRTEYRLARLKASRKMLQKMFRQKKIG